MTTSPQDSKITELAEQIGMILPDDRAKVAHLLAFCDDNVHQAYDQYNDNEDVLDWPGHLKAGGGKSPPEPDLVPSPAFQPLQRAAAAPMPVAAPVAMPAPRDENDANDQIQNEDPESKKEGDATINFQREIQKLKLKEKNALINRDNAQKKGEHEQVEQYEKEIRHYQALVKAAVRAAYQERQEEQQQNDDTSEETPLDKSPKK